MAQTSEATPTAFPLGSTTVLQLQASNGSSTSSRSKQQLRAHPQSTKSRLVSIPRTTARSALAVRAVQPHAGSGPRDTSFALGLMASVQRGATSMTLPALPVVQPLLHWRRSHD